jgi:hypothetical protein
MRRVARIVLIACMLAAVPLRGYAGALMLFCGSHDHAAASTAAHEHQHDDHAHSHGSSDDRSSHATSACSFCASCCTAAVLVSEPSPRQVDDAPDARAIPLLARLAPDFIPVQLDRPPASL